MTAHLDDSSCSMNFDRLALVVLAAGQSSRMGQPKALIELDGRPLLEHILTGAVLDELGDVVVVLGHHADAIRPIVERCNCRHVLNDEPDRGRTGSIQCGLRLLHPDIRGAFLQPVDCPLVSPNTFRSLAGHLGEADVVIPTHNGQGGHPPLFASRLFEAILAAGPDQPLRDILNAPGISRCTIELDDPAVALNVDRPEDLAALRELSSTLRLSSSLSLRAEGRAEG